MIKMTTAAWTCRTTAGADWGTQTADTHTNMLACHAAQYACGVLDACADWLGGWVSDLELLKTLIVFEVFRGSVLSNIIYIQKPNSLDWKLAPTLVLRHYFADAFTWCVCVCVCVVRRSSDTFWKTSSNVSAGIGTSPTSCLGEEAQQTADKT